MNKILERSEVNQEDKWDVESIYDKIEKALII